MSWWPKHEMWSHPWCEWNKGMWTWDNEIWFRNRRRDILAGTAKALTVKEWQVNLRQGRFKRSLANLEQVAAMRVESVLAKPKAV